MDEEFFFSIPINDGEIVIGRESLNYQRVLDDFSSAKVVRILTFNISKSQYRNKLIDALKSISEEADVKIITNIPSRMPTYYSNQVGESMKKRYRNNFAAYLDRLSPENFKSNPEVSFNFDNHAKIIGTENIVYIGSANYSDESADNIESGTIITDRDVIKRIYSEFFPVVINESIPYFEDIFNEFRLFLLSLKAKFAKWIYWFDNHLIWQNQITGLKGLRDPFELDEYSLAELNSDIDELDKLIVHLENTYSEEDDEYNLLIDTILNEYRKINISWMIDFTSIDTALYEFMVFNEETRAIELLQVYPDAYDENLDVCVEKAMDSARDELENMRNSLEEDIFSLRNQIKIVLEFLEWVHLKTLQYADKWIAQKVDNT